jgi:hypothetical protein
MLQKIRDVSHGWFTWMVLGAVCIAFAFWGVQNYFMKGPQGDVVAKVNGEKITEKVLLNAYRQLQQQKSAWLEAGVVTQEQLRNIAFEELIRNTVIQQALAKQGFEISFEQIKQYLYTVPEFQVNGHYSAAQYSKIIQRLPYSENEFFAQIREGMLLHQLRMGIQESAFVLPNEVKATTKLLNQTRDIGYAMITEKQLTGAPEVTDEQMKAYYEQHQSQFQTPEKIQLNYIELNAETLWKNLPDAEKTSTSKEQFFAEKADELAKLSYENPNSLEVAASQLALPIKTTAYVSRQGEHGTGITSNAKVLQAAFDDEVLEQGYNSDIINVDPTTHVVVRVKSHQPSAILPFSEVQGKVKAILSIQWQQQAMKTLANTLVEKLRQGSDPKKLMSQYHLTWENANITTAEKSVNSAVTSVAFMQASPIDNAHPSVTSTQLPNGNYAVIAVLAVNYQNDSGTVDDEKVKQELTTQNQQLAYNLYQRSQLQHAKIRKF